MFREAACVSLSMVFQFRSLKLLIGLPFCDVCPGEVEIFIKMRDEERGFIFCNSVTLKISKSLIVPATEGEIKMS